MIRKFIYTLWLFILIFCIVISIKSPNSHNFLAIIESRTFDIRQSILAKNKTQKPSPEIIIIAIDDASYEYILDKYGEWPLPRDIYAKVISYIEETYKPQSLFFDLMFVKSIKSSVNADKILGDTIKRYDNIYLAMNFDYQDTAVRTPPTLKDSIAVNVDNNSLLVDLDKNSYSNCRTIIPEILDNTDHIGFTNVTRSEDGILRNVPIFLKYNDKYYPQLGFLAGLQYLKSTGIYKEESIFKIDSNSNLRLGKRKIPLDKDGSVILNWYGLNSSYRYIPFYKLILAANGESTNENFDLEDKLIYFGATAGNLYDIKTVPVARNYPGVEVQATFANNIIDNNIIKHYDSSTTFLISIILALITILIVLSENSVIIGSLASLTLYILYIFISYFVMKYFNMWIELVFPLLFSTLTLIAAYIIKYLIKSRDFDRQYLLATTDGLTELYNHRYFKDQMRQLIDSSKRYGTPFSLIIIDIDFFKKFNDTYGHQSGDAVLKQVAQTLKKNVRSSDIVCRYGGEEMSIILTNTDYETALNIAQKICDKVAGKNFKLPNNIETKVTISLGVSTFPQDGIGIEELIEVADKHLYNAKEAGRNQVGK